MLGRVWCAMQRGIEFVLELDRSGPHASHTAEEQRQHDLNHRLPQNFGAADDDAPVAAIATGRSRRQEALTVC